MSGMHKALGLLSSAKNNNNNKKKNTNNNINSFCLFYLLFLRVEGYAEDDTALPSKGCAESSSPNTTV
jgi:hypothetical protein